MRRVVVTGLGLATPGGCSVESTWSSIFGSKSFVQYLTAKEYPEFGSAERFIAAPMAPDFPFEAWRNKLRASKGLSEAISLYVADQALTDAGWAPSTDGERERSGIVYGTASGNITEAFNAQKKFDLEGYGDVSSQDVFRSLFLFGASEVAHHFGLLGPINTLIVTCSTGGAVIGNAMKLIQRGEADVMLAVAASDSGNPAFSYTLHMVGGGIREDEDPETCCRPFDESRKGTVVATGGGAFVLEELSHAVQRKAKILGELVGYGIVNEGENLTLPNKQGAGAYTAMMTAITDSGLAPTDIDHVNSHSTGTQEGDLREAIAIHRVFGSHKPVISTSKPILGHAIAAAGIIQAALAVVSMQRNIVPPIRNLKVPLTLEDGSKLNIAREVVKTPIRAIVTNALGFGGVCTSLVFRKFPAPN